MCAKVEEQSVPCSALLFGSFGILAGTGTDCRFEGIKFRDWRGNLLEPQGRRSLVGDRA
jgi:hypothetical protein